MEKTQYRQTYSINFRTSREKECEKGRRIISLWCGTLSELEWMARGILAGLCTLGGYKHGHCDIYEVSELDEKLVSRINW